MKQNLDYQRTQELELELPKPHRATRAWLLCLAVSALFVPWADAENFPEVANVNVLPHSWAGLILSGDGSRGSGAVVRHPKIVISCAHVVHTPGQGYSKQNNYWIRQWHQTTRPPTSQGVLLRDFYEMVGYASAVTTSGVTSRNAFASDFVCHYSYSNLAGGGAAGYWPDGRVPLAGNKQKYITGYRGELYPQGTPTYKMQETGPFTSAYSTRTYAEYMWNPKVFGGGGMSGGPVWVDGFFAGVHVSGAEEDPDGDIIYGAGVRAVTQDAWNLVDNAIQSTKYWKNSRLAASNVADGERNAVYNPNWNHVYYKGTDNNIWVSLSVGGGWTSQRLSSTSNVAGSLCFNAAWNNIYYRGTDGFVWACYIRNGVWVTDRLGGTGNVGGELTFNSNWMNIFYRGTDNNPWACSIIGGSWVNQRLSFATAGRSWVFDPVWNNIYQRGHNTTHLAALLFNGSNWEVRNIPNGHSVTGASGLDTNRIIHFAKWNMVFYHGTDNNIMASSGIQNNWLPNRLGNAGNVSGALAMHTDFNAVFYRGNDGNMWACSLDNGAWRNAVIGTGGNVSPNSAILYGSKWGHMYYRGTDGALWASHFD